MVYISNETKFWELESEVPSWLKKIMSYHEKLYSEKDEEQRIKFFVPDVLTSKEFLNLKDHHVSNALNLKHSEYNWTILESSVENCLKSLGKLNNSELKQIGESIKPKGIYAGVEELKKISNENKSHDKYSELFDDDANKNNTVRDISISGFDSRI
ncbi:6231_t:CDS:2, partial [Entrophospora sp. SA101]